MSVDHTSNPADLPAGTLVELFFGAVDAFPGVVAFQSFEDDGTELRDLTYVGASEIVRAVSGALQAGGLERGDRAAILSENRPEWALADYGCLCAGVRDVPIYPTLTAEQVAYILENSGSRLVFAEDADQMEKVRDAAGRIGADIKIVVFDAPAELPEVAVSWDAFLEEGREQLTDVSDDDYRARAEAARPEDVATILYTSGTTGNPKGVQLTHNNLFSNVTASSMVLPTAEGDSTLSFLPLSHVFQRMVDYLHFAEGVTIAYAHSVQTVAADLPHVRPTIVCAVPRLYEKVYAAVMAADGLKGKLVRWATGVADRRAEILLNGGRPGPLLSVQHAFADALVFKKVRSAVGGRVRYFVSGSAPLAVEINRFFYSIGLRILEGYGLTETSPVIAVNTFDDFRIGTVGKVVPGTEVRIAGDGEILVRGPQVMKGYYGMPEATAAAIDEEGWFRTGDVGEIDHDGFLRITDRKKDLFKTSGGKYVAPQPIENRLKTLDHVEQVLLVGDRRKFCALLIVPSMSALESWAKAIGIRARGRELLARREVHELFENEVFGQLRGLARHEMPKKIGLIPEPFTVEDGTLTPTQKIKRSVVGERYVELIDSFYDEASVDQTVFVAS